MSQVQQDDANQERLEELIEASHSELAEIAADYGLGPLRDAALCSSGRINSNYRIKTDRGEYLVRIYPAHRAVENIDFELSVLEHLSAGQFLCQTPQHRTNGDLVSQLRGQRLAVLSYLPGRALTQGELSADVCQQVGTAYGTMQQLLTGFHPRGTKRNCDDPRVRELFADSLSSFQTHGASLDDQHTLQQAWDSLKGRPWRADPMVVHADLYFENVVFDGPRLRGFVDFDDSYLGDPILDLALAVMEFAVCERSGQEADKACGFDFELEEEFLRAYFSAGGLVVDPEVLWKAMRYQCIKFLGYTVELTIREGESPSTNDYFRRLVAYDHASVREQIQHRAARAFSA